MNVMVLACHPDDETLGCGGTLLKHKRKGDKINWVIATCMTKGSGYDGRAIARRAREIKAVGKAYGFDGVYELSIPTTKVDRCAGGELVAKISAIFDKVHPEVVYLPFKFDVHSDHRLLFDAAYGCTKIFRHAYVKKILMMETISETEFSPSLMETAFTPNFFVDISDYLDKKIRILKTYKGQTGAHPFPRSITNLKALALFRGATAGCRYAESFVLLKAIE